MLGTFMQDKKEKMLHKISYYTTVKQKRRDETMEILFDVFIAAALQSICSLSLFCSDFALVV